MTGAIGSGAEVVIGVVVTLWLASLGAVWKVANILSAITGELRELRNETRANGRNITTLQTRMNVTPADHVNARMRS